MRVPRGNPYFYLNVGIGIVFGFIDNFRNIHVVIIIVVIGNDVVIIVVVEFNCGVIDFNRVFFDNLFL